MPAPNYIIGPDLPVRYGGMEDVPIFPPPTFHTPLVWIYKMAVRASLFSPLLLTTIRLVHRPASIRPLQLKLQLQPAKYRQLSIMTTKLTDWADKETGEFNRKPSVFRNFISRDPGAQFPPEKNRYHLFVSYACPWAHRTLIVRQLKGLEDVISFSSVHWHMTQGGWHFATPSESSTEMATAPEPVTGASFLRDIYHRVNPDYSGRFTVPTLWDTKSGAIVSNESSEIIRMLYEEFDEFVPAEKRGGWLLPEGRRAEIDGMNEWVYDTVNNGVYKAGFATSQGAYEAAMGALFESLQWLEDILAASPGKYLLGDELTEVDVRLFTTIVRFDPVYVQHFKCNVGMIRHDYPALHKWLRHLYWDIPAFKDTTNFEHIKKHYTKSHTQINPHSITPVGPLPDMVPKDKE